MKKLLFVLQNYILPGLIGAACGFLLVIKEIQLLLASFFPAYFTLGIDSLAEASVTGVVIFAAMYLVFRNANTWYYNSYSTTLVCFLLLTLIFMVNTVTSGDVTTHMIYNMFYIGVLQSAIITYLVLIDFNFVEGGHRKWF